MSSIRHAPLWMEKVSGYKKERYGLRSPEILVSARVYVADKPMPPPSQEEIELCNNAREIATTARALNESSVQLRRLLDDQVFIAESLSFLTSRMTGREHRPIPGHGPRDLDYGEDHMNCDTDEERRSLAARTRDALLTRVVLLSTLRSLSSLVLNMPPSPSMPGFPEENTPVFFLRAFKNSNHSPYDNVLGFRSSEQPSTPPDYRASTLQTSSYLNAHMFRSHCEKTDDPSGLIAMSDSPARVRKFINSWSNKDMQGEVIAVISVSKLQSMGVLFNRTTTLARHLKLPISGPGRVEYVHENYWVAYRWIPVECIERYLTLSDLVKICDRRGIGADDHHVRLAPEDFLEDTSAIVTGMGRMHLE